MFTGGINIGPYEAAKHLTGVSRPRSGMEAWEASLITTHTLLANLVIFHNALDLRDVVRGLVADGWTITAAELGAISPYLRAHIRRFGAYATDEINVEPAR